MTGAPFDGHEMARIHREIMENARRSMERIGRELQASMRELTPKLEALRVAMQTGEGDAFAAHPDVQEFVTYARGWYE